MRIAVIADIHSNDIAFAAVLDDLRNHKIDTVVHLGDAFNGPINPSGVARMLQGMDAVHVRGNGDRMVCDSSGANPSKSALFARERLTAEDIAFVSTWRALYEGEMWLACHGSPRSDTEYLLEEVTPAGVRARSAGAVVQILGDAPQSLVLCGHTHVPRVMYAPNRCVIVNPGSIGLPAYCDDEPYPHKMENGSPHARYAIVERTGDAWSVSLKAIPYDWESAARIAAASGFPEWAHSIRTGYA